MNKETVAKLEINIFVILLFLQNFALIRTEGFGIAALTIYMGYIFVKYKFFMQIEKNFLKCMIILYSIIGLSCIFNQTFNFMQIARLTMIIFVAWSSYKYSNVIQEKNKVEYFYKIFFLYLIVITIYGIYQLVAATNNWPIFLNIFSNNPSYSIKGIYTVYKGWNESARIYATFYEPSAYAIFLINAYFFIMCSKTIQLKHKVIFSILTIINIIFTYARSGWITFLYFIGIFLLFKIIRKDGLLKKVGKILIILLPIISVCIMSVIGLRIFKDHSSKVRTYSSLYYLKNSFDDVKSISIGHGVGAILNIEDGITYNDYKIEKYAHNGYIDIMYQYGIVILLLFIYVILRYFKNNKLQDEWLAYASVFVLSCFGTVFYVESVISLICLMVSFIKFQKFDEERKINEEREREIN